MKFTRRKLLQSAVVLASACGVKTALGWPVHGIAAGPPPYDPTIVNVFEITQAAPDIVRVEVRDGVRQPGNIETSGSSYGTPGTFFGGTNPGTGAPYYVALNLDGKVRRWLDARSPNILNLAAALIPGNYGTIGGKTVTAIYSDSEPFDQVLTHTGGGAGSQWLGGGFTHYLYLQLSGTLSNGNYSISFPSGTGLGTVAFNYNDKVTRSDSIAATQVGHRPDDGCKLAYLRCRAPGLPTNYSSVTFDTTYSLSTFYIIDSTGTVKFTGSIVQRADPTTVYSDAVNVDYDDLSQPPFVLTAMTKANPGLATYSGTGWSIANGDKLRFENVSGMTQLMTQGAGASAKAYTVSNLDTGAKTFNIDQDTTAFSTLTTGTFSSPTVENSINKTYNGNSGGIYVYQMDYSAFNPGNTGQTYYVYVPGVGVSYPFVISDTVYNAVASVHCGGYYNQLNGTALDGRFGYTRPVSFKDGQNGVQIFWSYMPASYSSEWSYASPSITASLLGTATWQTSTQQVGLGGENFDAGDWDAAAYSHGLPIFTFLDLYEYISNPNTNFGFPKSTASLDPTFYAGTDFMGDLVHQAIWWVQFYLSTQQADGSCASGLGYSDGGGGPSMYEPSCYSYHTAWLYAADPINNFTIAGVVAKLASVMFNAYAANPGVANLLTLGNYYFTQAKAAWTWAEGIWASNSANGGDGTVQDAYYKGVLSLDTKAGWSGAQYTSAMTSMVNGCAQPRTFAAGALFRASSLQPGGSPDTTFSAIIETQFALGGTGFYGAAAWEYCWANYSSATHTTQKNYYFGASGHGFPSATSTLQVTGVGVSSYFSRAPSFLAMSCIDPIRSIIIAQTSGFTDPSAVSRLYSYMQGIQNYFSGANQIGYSFTSGIGKRWKHNMLVRDKEALCLTDMMPGITAYTTQVGQWPSGGQFGGGTTGSNFWSQGNNGNADPPYNAGKTIYPSLYGRPQLSGGLDNSYFINWSEFSTEQTIQPMQVWTMWLDAR